MNSNDEQMQQHTASRLNTNSYISIALVFTIVGCTLWINNNFKDMNYRLERIENKSAENAWTGVDMFKWAVKLQKDNPGVKVPEPKHERD